MASNQIIFFIVAALVAFLIGLAKGGFGGMPGALATPLMALVVPADQAIGLVLPILMFADLFAVAFHWRRWDNRLVILLLPGALVGVTIGTLFITNVPTETLRLTLGIIVILFAIYKLIEERLLGWFNYQKRSWHGLLAGVIAGFSSALAHTGGPPVSIYLLMQNVTPSVFNSTAALFFFILNWIKVPYYFQARLFNFEQFLKIVWLMPLVPIGVWVGRLVSDRFDQKTFERIILAMLVMSALLLIFS